MSNSAAELHQLADLFRAMQSPPQIKEAFIPAAPPAPPQPQGPPQGAPPQGGPPPQGMDPSMAQGQPPMPGPPPAVDPNMIAEMMTMLQELMQVAETQTQKGAELEKAFAQMQQKTNETLAQMGAQLDMLNKVIDQTGSEMPELLRQVGAMSTAPVTPIAPMGALPAGAAPM